MAKTQEALLQEVVGQLRKLNQASVRDRLRESEEAKRAETLALQGETQEVQQQTIIDGATDFQRRFIAGQAKTFTDKALQQSKSKEEHQLTMINLLMELNRGVGGLAGILLQNEAAEALRYRNNIRNLNEKEIEAKNNALKMARPIGDTTTSGSDTLGEGIADPGGSFGLGTAIKTGLGIAGGLALFKGFKAFGPAMFRLGLVAWAIAGVGYSIRDMIAGYKQDGVAGALANLFGGDGEGGLMNAIKTGFKLAGVGMAAGAAIGAVGGPIGFIAGGIIGGVIGLIGGLIGSDKMKEDFKAAGAYLSAKWDDLGASIHGLGKDIGDFFYTPAVGGQQAGPHGTVSGAKFLGGTISTDFLKSIPGMIAEKWNAAKAFIGNLASTIGNWFYSGGDTEAGTGIRSNIEIMGGVITWDPNTSFKEKISAKWNMAMNYIGDRISAVGAWFYTDNGDTASLFGGRLEMPSWDRVVTNAKNKWDAMWETILDIPNRIGDMVKSLFPEKVQEWLGWTKTENLGAAMSTLNVGNGQGPASKTAVQAKLMVDDYMAGIRDGVRETAMTRLESVNAGISPGHPSMHIERVGSSDDNRQIYNIHQYQEMPNFGIAYPGGREIPSFLRLGYQ